jgi:hypothetical protein
MTYKAVDYEFNNSLERQARLNLSGKLGSSGLNNIYVNVNTDHGSVGLAVNEFNQLKTEVVNANDVVKIQGYEGSLFGWTNVTSTSGALNTTDSATTALNGKVFNSALVDTEAIKVYTVNSSGGGGSSNIEAIIPGAPTIPVPLSATSYYDGTNTHYPLETFDNALNAKIFNATTGDTEAIKVSVVSGGGGGGGGLVQIQAYNASTSAYEDLLTTATGGLLRVQARSHDYAGNDISSTVVNTKRGLDVNVVGNDNLGAYGNIHTGSLATTAFSTPLVISNTYGNNCILTYEDTSSSVTTALNLLASNDGTNYVVIGTIQPAVSLTGKRTFSTIVRLKAFTHIKIQNLSIAVTAIANVVASVFSS